MPTYKEGLAIADAILYMKTTETRIYTMPFADILPTTDTSIKSIAAGDSSIDAFNYAGTDVGSSILSAKSVSGTNMLVTISALVLGQEYIIKFLAEGSVTSSRLELQLKVICRNNLEGEF